MGKVYMENHSIDDIGYNDAAANSWEAGQLGRMHSVSMQGTAARRKKPPAKAALEAPVEMLEAPVDMLEAQVEIAEAAEDLAFARGDYALVFLIHAEKKLALKLREQEERQVFDEDDGNIGDGLPRYRRQEFRSLLTPCLTA